MEIELNGQAVTIDDALADTPALWVLRDHLNMTGTKYGCGVAACGACTVLVDGEAVRSCITPLSALSARKVTTIEGLSKLPVGAALQSAWVEGDVPQCGYCQSGQLMSATALLLVQRKPNDEAVAAAMEGNICRCGTYGRIRKAIAKAAERLE